MTRANRKHAENASLSEPMTLASMLAALERSSRLSDTRRRDLRSAVKRVAELLGNEPARIPFDLPAISVRLNAINPVALGMTAKRWANIRSDFLAAAKSCGLKPLSGRRKLTHEWKNLLKHLSRPEGLSRFAGYASARAISPSQVTDRTIGEFITAVREGSLHRNPNKLHRQVTVVWNKAARVPGLGLKPVTVASFRGPPRRVNWELLPRAFRQDVDNYLAWCGRSDPFTADARPRALAPQTLALRRHQIHAVVTALVEAGTKPASIRSLGSLVTPNNLKSILRRRLESVRGSENTFNFLLAHVLLQIAREWVKVNPECLAELKSLVRKMPPAPSGLTGKNKRFLRQFDDPDALRRLVQLPEKLWAEVKRDSTPSFRTLAKAHTALAIAILTYIPLRLQNLADLEFSTHLFMNVGPGAVSTLELSNVEVKNKTELAFDIPLSVAKMLLEYRDRLAPKIIGHRPKRLFENVDGAAKAARSLATTIRIYAKKRAGIALSPHQFRHLSAKVLLDAQPGAYETVRQLLGHKNQQTTVAAYAGIDTRRAADHHRRLVELAIAQFSPSPRAGHQARRGG
jgi:integrase